MEIDAGILRKTTRHVAIESENFKPIKLSIEKVSSENGITHKSSTLATFNDGSIKVSINGTEAMIVANRPFVLEGNCNYFLNEFIRAGFKRGTVVKAYIYDPTIDLEDQVLMIGKVIGREKVEINDSIRELIHLGYSIENYKNIDVFIDKNGVIHRMIIFMLNNRLDLVISE
jgi:hypothetical protein